jgi:hypothetical protein
LGFYKDIETCCLRKLGENVETELRPKTSLGRKVGWRLEKYKGSDKKSFDIVSEGG